MEQETEVFCQRNPWKRDVTFWIRKRMGYGKCAIALPISFKVMTAEDEGVQKDGCFDLTDEETQAFMDELWRAGFRPREGTGSAGSLAATERHLADMQKLVFKGFPK